MIDVSQKTTTLRIAVARAVLRASPSSIAHVRAGTVPKGDPLAVARAAAALAVKNTPQLIPFCHPLRVDWVGVEFVVEDNRIVVDVTVKAVDRTGVEVEAMTGAATAALVVYDMLKMLDDTLEIERIRLLEKRGGKSDWRKVDPSRIRAAVLVSSDSVAAGRKDDLCGLMIRERLEETGMQVAAYAVVPDEVEDIVRTVCSWIDHEGIRLVITTGGTGFSPRDRTPEAMQHIVDREAPGIMEAARAHGQERTPFSMLSRGRAGTRKDALVVNLPGSRAGTTDALDALLPGLVHAFKMLRGGGHEEDPRQERTS
jgi:cyclic pyranopterin monophosphate synthase